jgi:cytochrome oxidase assembly protein ShyY1
MAGIFLSLGIWQLARNNHKHAIIAREKAAYAKPAPDVTALASGAGDGEPVQARGTFDAAHETVLRNQVHHDAVGVDVLTPLRLSDGTAVLVDRGWVHASSGASLTTDPPPAGTAVVHGLLHSSNTFASGDTVNHLADGRLAVPRVDLAAIGATLPYPLKKVWIEARAITPTPMGNSPALPQPPSPDPVNHLEYAIEWFAFALIPIVGWPIALRRLLRQRTAATSSNIASAASTDPITTRKARVGNRANKP